MFKPSHLTDEAANALAGAADERVYFIQSKRWVTYPKAVQILEHFNKMLKHPRTTRMPSLIVCGDSGMGKSMLIDRFKADCAAGSAADTAPKHNRVLVELSGRPTERRLYSQILAAVDAPKARALASSMWSGAPSIFFATSASKFSSSTRSTTTSPRPGANSGSS